MCRVLWFFRIISEVIPKDQSHNGRIWGFLSYLTSKSASKAPGSGRSPGEGNDYPLQYSCLENSKNRGAWWATVDGVAKGQTQLRY